MNTKSTIKVLTITLALLLSPANTAWGQSPQGKITQFNDCMKDISGKTGEADKLLQHINPDDVNNFLQFMRNTIWGCFTAKDLQWRNGEKTGKDCYKAVGGLNKLLAAT